MDSVMGQSRDVYISDNTIDVTINSLKHAAGLHSDKVTDDMYEIGACVTCMGRLLEKLPVRGLYIKTLCTTGNF